MSVPLAVILGGGAGTRLFPLTRDRAKPAVPLAGKYRLVDVPISNCINSGVNRIFVVTQFNSASLNKHIARSYRFDRFGAGFVTLLAAEQTLNSENWYQGTADAVRRTTFHLKGHPHEHVIILSGDQLYSMDYRQMLAHHIAYAAEITIAVTPVTADEAPAFGILKTDNHNRISEFYEKPRREDLDGKESAVERELADVGRVYLASMGIYIFDANVLYDALDSRPEDHDFGKEVIPAAIHDRRVFAYPFTGYWNDIGTVRSFFETNIMLAQPHPAFNLYESSMPLFTDAWTLPPAKVTRSTLHNAMIGEGSVVVDCEIVDSVIGIRSFIDRGSHINRTVLMGADYFRWERSDVRDGSLGPMFPGVGQDARISNAIIDKNASIGNRCVITNTKGIVEGSGPGFYIRDGIVVIPKNADIPDDTII